MDDDEDIRRFRAVVNHEEQYSIWFAERELPLGWRDAGKEGTKRECLDYIEKVWTDMRPLSLRKAMEAWEKEPAPVQDHLGYDDEPSLVSRLCSGKHAVAISLRPENTARAVRECLDEGYLHIKFTGTRGGTHLVIDVDPATTALGAADFEAGVGTIHIEGELTLDYERVRCIADIDLATLTGQGFLRLVQ